MKIFIENRELLDYLLGVKVTKLNGNTWMTHQTRTTLKSLNVFNVRGCQEVSTLLHPNSIISLTDSPGAADPKREQSWHLWMIRYFTQRNAWRTDKLFNPAEDVGTGMVAHQWKSHYTANREKVCHMPLWRLRSTCYHSIYITVDDYTTSTELNSISLTSMMAFPPLSNQGQLEGTLEVGQRHELCWPSPSFILRKLVPLNPFWEKITLDHI